MIKNQLIFNTVLTLVAKILAAFLAMRAPKPLFLEEIRPTLDILKTGKVKVINPAEIKNSAPRLFLLYFF